jgi:hypothetical protein
MFVRLCILDTRDQRDAQDRGEDASKNLRHDHVQEGGVPVDVPREHDRSEQGREREVGRPNPEHKERVREGL